MRKTDSVLTWTDNKCRMVITNPDERGRQHWRDRLAAAYAQEVQEFIQECQVAMRKMKPGDTITLSSRPIEVTMEYAAEEAAAEAKS